MKAQPRDYRYQVCPHCNSKKIKRVVMMRMGDERYMVVAEERRLYRTGYLCECCKRYNELGTIKYIYDRKEMCRDMLRLGQFLRKKS